MSVIERLPESFKLVVVSQQDAVLTAICEGGLWLSGNIN